jgi:hypothetical protein
LVEAGAAFVAWLGAALIVLADGRRGLALGTALAAVGIAVVVVQDAGFIAADAIVVGGSIAAAARLRSGPPGWEIMPAGSTPRLVLCIAAGLLSLWIAVSITGGPGAALRFTVLSVIGLSAARVLWSDDASVLLTASGVLAVAIAATAGVVESTVTVWPYLAGALIVAAIVWLPARRAHAA